jgi:hypothetical protein
MGGARTAVVTLGWLLGRNRTRALKRAHLREKLASALLSDTGFQQKRYQLFFDPNEKLFPAQSGNSVGVPKKAWATP